MRAYDLHGLLPSGLTARSFANPARPPFGRLEGYWTTIFPSIKGCGVQWYGNGPVLLNRREKRAPGSRSPESQMPTASDVVECGSWPPSSQFTHVTIAPAGTASES